MIVTTIVTSDSVVILHPIETIRLFGYTTYNGDFNMIRTGDRVYHFLDMKHVGTVLNITFKDSNMHLEGGTSQQRVMLTVRLDDGRIVEMLRDDVLKAE